MRFRTITGLGLAVIAIGVSGVLGANTTKGPERTTDPATPATSAAPADPNFAPIDAISIGRISEIAAASCREHAPISPPKDADDPSVTPTVHKQLLAAGFSYEDAGSKVGSAWEVWEHGCLRIRFAGTHPSAVDYDRISISPDTANTRLPGGLDCDIRQVLADVSGVIALFQKALATPPDAHQPHPGQIIRSVPTEFSSNSVPCYSQR